jgi:hypothetical protein
MLPPRVVVLCFSIDNSHSLHYRLPASRSTGGMRYHHIKGVLVEPKRKQKVGKNQ